MNTTITISRLSNFSRMVTDISVVTTAWVVGDICSSGGAVVPEIARFVLETNVPACIAVPEIAIWVVALETGATHLVQIVEVEVLRTVERTVVTFWVGLPPTGVTVVVTGQDVIVVCTLFSSHVS